MWRNTDNSYPNPPGDVPEHVVEGPSPLMQQATGAFGVPWPRKPLNGKPKGVGKPSKTSKPSRSGLNKLRRVSHGSPFF